MKFEMLIIFSAFLLSQGCAKSNNSQGDTQLPELPLQLLSVASVDELKLQDNHDGTLTYGWTTSGADYTIGMVRLRPGTSCDYAVANTPITGWVPWVSDGYLEANNPDNTFVIPATLPGCTYEYCITAISYSDEDQTGKIKETAGDTHVKCGFVEY